MPCAITACNIHEQPQSVNAKFPAERFRGGGDLPQLKARQELTDEFRSKILTRHPSANLPPQRGRNRRSAEDEGE